MASLKIRDIFYDHATQTFTGKTAPNASVYVSVIGINQRVVVQADQNGHFVVTDQGEIQPGWVVTFSASLDNLISGIYEYTIPEAPANDLTIVPVKDAATKPTGKEFPKTGATTNIALSLVGSFAVLVAAAMIITRKLAGKKG
nr:LPXTG cell wall anchor domain-containing protein [Enterococcus sp. BWR-S5]